MTWQLTEACQRTSGSSMGYPSNPFYFEVTLFDQCMLTVRETGTLYNEHKKISDSIMFGKVVHNTIDKI